MRFCTAPKCLHLRASRFLGINTPNACAVFVFILWRGHGRRRACVVPVSHTHGPAQCMMQASRVMFCYTCGTCRGFQWSHRGAARLNTLLHHATRNTHHKVTIAVSPTAKRCAVCETKGVVLQIVGRKTPDAQQQTARRDGRQTGRRKEER